MKATLIFMFGAFGRMFDVTPPLRLLYEISRPGQYEIPFEVRPTDLLAIVAPTREASERFPATVQKGKLYGVQLRYARENFLSVTATEFAASKEHYGKPGAKVIYPLWIAVRGETRN